MRYSSRDVLVLLLAAIATVGNYYCYDMPGALNVAMREWLDSPYNEYQTQLSLLYSVYSLPNIILPLFGGILIDIMPPNLMLPIFSSLVCAGQILFTYGVQIKKFPVMVIGRFIFGLGAESLDVRVL